MLQQLLYYGWGFWAFYIVAQMVILHHKYGDGVRLKDPDDGRAVLFPLWSLVEPLRLLVGYHGNLREDFPSLLIFIGERPAAPRGSSWPRPPRPPARKRQQKRRRLSVLCSRCPSLRPATSHRAVSPPVSQW